MLRLTLPVAVLLVLAVNSSLQAVDGFRLRSLNPFDDPESEIAPPPQPQVIGLPDYRQAGESQDDPSIFERIGDGARSTMHRVGAVMRAPFESPAGPPRTASRGPSRSWFHLPWSRDDAQAREARTVEEFIERPRPPF